MAGGPAWLVIATENRVFDIKNEAMEGDLAVSLFFCLNLRYVDAFSKNI